MRRRYYIVAVCLLVMSFLLTACGGKEKDKKVIHIQIAYENNTDEPLSKACEKWKELLEEKSNGEFQVDLYPSSQLGTKNDIIYQSGDCRRFRYYPCKWSVLLRSWSKGLRCCICPIFISVMGRYRKVSTERLVGKTGTKCKESNRTYDCWKELALRSA